MLPERCANSDRTARPGLFLPILMSSPSENLLEQLRAKYSGTLQQNVESWTDFAKQIRMATLERRRDMSVIQESLEKLQNVLPALSIAQTLERVEATCKKLRIKYNAQGSTVYISTDMFYVEISIDTTSSSQTIRDVRVAHGNHGNQPTSVLSMAQALRQGDVKVFTEHLQGFLDMYNVGSESMKAKFFIVQQSLETDLEKLNKLQQLQPRIPSLSVYIYKLPLGLVQPRQGGLPMRLTFFITPYDFLDPITRSTLPSTVESVLEHQLGFSATIGIEEHAMNNQLQTIPLMNMNKTSDNKISPLFSPSNNVNSVIMPAAFTLKFKKPLAVSQYIMTSIERSTGSAKHPSALTFKPMMDAIIEAAKLDIVAGCRSSYVALPGQLHKYVFNDMRLSGAEGDKPMMGCVISKLYFIHPAFIPHALQLLRQQLMLNSMIESCLRTQSCSGEEKAIQMEVTVVTTQMINVMFKLPSRDCLASCDFDLIDVSQPKCTIFPVDDSVCTSAHATKVLQRSYSIPVTMRALIQQAGSSDENSPPDSKKCKVDSGEMMQKVVAYYTSLGHYVPYGSVNSVSHNCTKNIDSNKYSLCLRRFAGYKRPATQFKVCTPFTIHTKVEPLSGMIISKPPQYIEQSKLSQNPMLASLLDDGRNLGTTIPAKNPTSQHQAPILMDLLEGTGDPLDKKARKPRKRQITADGSQQGTLNRKRKKSDNDELVREMTSKVQAEIQEHKINSSPKSAPSTPITESRKPFPKPGATTLVSSLPHSGFAALSGEPNLTRLLTDPDAEQAKAKGKQFLNRSESSFSIESDSGDGFGKTPKPLVESKPKIEMETMERPGQLTVKIPKLKDVKLEDLRKPARSQSVILDVKEKKMKKTASEDLLKFREVKVSDVQIKLSDVPTDKGITPRITIKNKGGQLQVMAKSVASAVKAEEKSPKDKLKKPSDKDRKKVQKASVSQDLTKVGTSQSFVQQMGFYGASSLKSLPKIPKIKAGDSKPSPSSPMKDVPITPTILKSPGAADWQRASPVNRPTPPKPDELIFSTLMGTRTAKTLPVSQADISKRPALLPTPSVSGNPTLSKTAPVPPSPKQRKGSLNDVISKLAGGKSPIAQHSGLDTQHANTASNSTFSGAALSITISGGSRPSTETDINSPEDTNSATPTKSSIQADNPQPASPFASELFYSPEPKAIPLDSHRKTPDQYKNVQQPGKQMQFSASTSSLVARPLTFSPNTNSQERLDDEARDVPLGCK